ncbi:MAG: hypothetical protein KAS32_00350 [Candidatus Peribacteraceae bacterium]|nr:hypothetical protein [Candidatus Peribacteraceae bacterium]
MSNNTVTEQRFYGGIFPEPFRSQLKRDMRKAYANCDVIGITPDDKRHRGKYYDMGADMCLVESNAKLGSARDPINWHDKDMYPAMIHDKVNVITCHDIKDKLEKWWGCDVNIIKILPPARGVTQHMADYANIQAEIDMSGLYFVSWSLLGKAICGVIKERGGQAVDIGAIVDGWAGQKTRSYHSKKHKL